MLVIALALVARFSTITRQSFWLDEAYTGHLVHLGFGAMLSEIPRSESTPPLYYVLGWGWTHVLGYSELALRSLSALAGVATVGVAYALAAHLAGTRAAVIAGFLLAVSPLLIWFSQEARAYSLAALLGTATVLCLVRYLDTLDARWMIGWAGSAALGLCTHYFVGFLVAPELLALFWHQRGRREAWAAAGLVAAVALALVPLALAQRGTGHADYIAQGSLVTRSLQVPKQFLVGYASPSQLVTASIAMLLVLGGGVWPLVRHRQAIGRSTVVALGIALSCVLVPLVLALVGADLLNTRNLLPALPTLLVVAAIGFAARQTWPRGGVLAASLAAVLAAVVVLVETNVAYQRTDWRGAADALGPPYGPRAIVVAPGSGLLPLELYQAGLRPLTRPAAVREIDTVGLPTPATGSGLGPSPRPGPRFLVPPTFHLAAATYDSAYTVLRFRAPRPVTVTSMLLAPTHLGARGFATLLQVPGARDR